jgi:hypothetical protein
MMWAQRAQQAQRSCQLYRRQEAAKQVGEGLVACMQCAHKAASKKSWAGTAWAPKNSKGARQEGRHCEGAPGCARTRRAGTFCPFDGTRNEAQAERPMLPRIRALPGARPRMAGTPWATPQYKNTWWSTRPAPQVLDASPCPHSASPYLAGCQAQDGGDAGLMGGLRGRPVAHGQLGGEVEGLAPAPLVQVGHLGTAGKKQKESQQEAGLVGAWGRCGRTGPATTRRGRLRGREWLPRAKSIRKGLKLKLGS